MARPLNDSVVQLRWSHALSVFSSASVGAVACCASPFLHLRAEQRGLKLERSEASAECWRAR